MKAFDAMLGINFLGMPCSLDSRPLRITLSLQLYTGSDATQSAKSAYAMLVYKGA